MGEKSQAQIEVELIRYYDSQAENRAKLQTEGRRLTAIRRAIGDVLPNAPADILDLGPGAGRDTDSLLAAGHGVVAVDLSLENARHCADRGAMALTGSAVSLPFQGNSFDAVWSLSVLMHIADEAIGDVLQEMARILRPGGVAIIGSWGGPDRPEQLPSNNVDIERNFSRRSDRVWQGLLANNLGQITHYETWPHPEHDGDWFYQWAEVRIG